jgi:hypothetical protein
MIFKFHNQMYMLHHTNPAIQDFFYGEQEGLGIYDCICENSMHRCG